MKKRMLTILVLILCLSLLTGCMCKHEVWNDADCVTPKTCAECGETEGTALGHVWLAATCETPKTCEVCATTEGAAKGHSWEDATCETPKTCTDCHLTEGEALGHSWIDATTEAPKTCNNCALTEGERIITDPRFTTEATKAIQGLWGADVVMTGEEIGLDPGIMEQVTLQLVLDMQNDGDLVVSVTIPDEEAFMKELIDSYVEVMYEEFASYGLDKETADTAMESEYGMGVREYLESTLGAISFNEMLASMYAEMNLGGVYFMEGSALYIGTNWKGAMTDESYTLDGDTLIIDSLSAELGRDIVFNRITE